MKQPYKIAVVILITLIILAIQLFTKFDIFSPAQGSNINTNIGRDKEVAIPSIQARALLPAGFTSEFTAENDYITQGNISNSDINIYLQYSNYEPLLNPGVDTGGSDPGQIMFVRLDGKEKILQRARIADTTIFRGGIFDPYNDYFVEYFTIPDYTVNMEDSDRIVGQYLLPVLQRGTVITNGVQYKVHLKNPSTPKEKQDEYLQLADKILLSIQPIQ